MKGVIPINRALLLSLGLLFQISCGDPHERADAYGNFEATTITVSAEQAGKLLEFNIREGQKLDSGHVSGLIDTIQLHLQKKQIEATIGILPKKLRNALDDIKVLNEKEVNIRRERDRVKRLVEKKAATPKQLDDLNGQLDVISQQIASVKSKTQTANRSILAEKEPLLAQLDIVYEQIRRCRIINPVTGRVLTKLSEAYEVVAPGKPLYRLGILDTMTLRFYVDAVQLQSLSLGQNVPVLIDRRRDDYEELNGTISWIADEAEFTPRTIQTKEDRINLVYAVKADVPNVDGRIKIGMPAEVKLDIQSK